MSVPANWRLPGHQACADALNPDQPERWVKPLKIKGVACDDRIACRLRTYYNVGIGDVRCTRPRQQRADGLSLRSVQRDYFGFVELDQPPKAYLPGRIPNDLREGSGRDYNPIPVLQSRVEDGEDPAVISFQRNQPASVENDSVHAAFRRYRSSQRNVRGREKCSRRESARLLQRLLHDRAELGSILKRFLDGLLNETRNGWGILGCDALADLLKLTVRQGDSDLRSGHAIDHTMNDWQQGLSESHER